MNKISLYSTVLFKDYITVKNANVGDVVTLSDGNEYEVSSNEIKFGGAANMCMDIIPYGANNTVDNW